MSNSINIKKYIRNSSWVIASKTINIIIGVFVSACVTRYLGTEQKGIMADANSIVGFFAFLSTFGLTDIVISKFTRERESSASLAATAMTIQLVGGLLAFVFSLISTHFFSSTKEVFIYAVVSASPYFFQAFVVFEYWSYSTSTSRNYSIAQSVIHIIFLIIRYIGVPLQASLLYFVSCTAIETIVGYLSYLFCYKSSSVAFVGRFRFNITYARQLIGLAIPMIIMGLSTAVYMKVDQIMVGKMMGNSELGIYSVGVMLSEYWYFIPAAVYTSFLPMISENGIDEKERLMRLQKFADIMTSIGFLAIIGVALLGKIVITLLYGEEFIASATVLKIYIWTGLFTCLSYCAHAYYIVNGDTKTIMWVNLIGAALNVVLNIILITRFGSIGAAIATLSEYFLVTTGQMVLLWRKYKKVYIVQIKSLFPFFRVCRSIIHDINSKFGEINNDRKEA